MAILDIGLWVQYSWAVLATIWLVTLPFTRRTKQSLTGKSLAVQRTIFLVGCFLIGSDYFRQGWLGHYFLPENRPVQTAGIAFTAAGCLFAIWGETGSGRKLERDGQSERRSRVDREGALSLRQASHLHRNGGRLHRNGFRYWGMAMHLGLSRHSSWSGHNNSARRAPHDGDLSPSVSAIPAAGKGADPRTALKRSEVTKLL